MPLDTEDGAKALQLITSRYDAREWRKKIEKTLSLPPKGMEDEVQRKIFCISSWRCKRINHDAPMPRLGWWAGMARKKSLTARSFVRRKLIRR